MFSEEYADSGEGFWYDNDLQLAAELGKTLLERNRELEGQIKQSQQIQHDQAKEIDLLAKQLDVLRNVNESRMRIYEEVDRNLQEVEKTNERFRQESRTDKEKIRNFTDTVDNLEVKCAELSSKLEEMGVAERLRLKHERQRTWSSVPSLVDATDLREFRGNYDYLGFPSIFQSEKKSTPAEKEQLRQMKETLRNVRLDLAKEQRRKENSETHLAQVITENAELKNKLDRIEKDQEELLATGLEVYVADLKSSQGMCRTWRAAASETSSIADPELIEHDLDELPRGEVVRLKCGGSAYGSRESLNLIGLEADDLTLESASDILISGHLADWDDEHDGMDELNQKSPDANKSLLGELEVQYRRLVRKYEILIDTKSKRLSTAKEVSTQDNLDTAETSTNGVKMRQKDHGANKEVQTGWRQSLNLDLRSPIDPIEGHFENGPPEYKRLFKEIFATLQKSTTFDDEMKAQLESKSSSSSPEDATVLGEKSG